MSIRLVPINDDNRDAVLSLSVREDQPFVAHNNVSLRQADEANAEQPGVARPFAIYAEDKLVGFCMFAFNPEGEDEDDRYWLWRFMIDKSEQGMGYGQAALRRSSNTSRKTAPTGSSCPPSRRTSWACTSITKPASGRPASSTVTRPS